MITIPELPVQRYAPKAVYFDATFSRGTMAQRFNHDDEKLPDTIAVTVSAGNEERCLGGFTTYLTPAMLVHLANTMLTDEERAAINAPAFSAAGVP